jgi:hypothetical protein
MGCDQMQGYLFAPPVDANRMTDILRQGAMPPRDSSGLRAHGLTARISAGDPFEQPDFNSEATVVVSDMLPGNPRADIADNAFDQPDFNSEATLVVSDMLLENPRADTGDDALDQPDFYSEATLVVSDMLLENPRADTPNEKR